MVLAVLDTTYMLESLGQTWKKDSALGLFLSATYKRWVSEWDQTKQPNCSKDAI